MNSDNLKIIGIAAASAAASSLITYNLIIRHRNRERNAELLQNDVSTPLRDGMVQPRFEQERLEEPSPVFPLEMRGASRDPFDPRPRTG